MLHHILQDGRVRLSIMSQQKKIPDRFAAMALEECRWWGYARRTRADSQGLEKRVILRVDRDIVPGCGSDVIYTHAFLYDTYFCYYRRVGNLKIHGWRYTSIAEEAEGRYLSGHHRIPGSRYEFCVLAQKRPPSYVVDAIRDDLGGYVDRFENHSTGTLTVCVPQLVRADRRGLDVTYVTAWDERSPGHNPGFWYVCMPGYVLKDELD